MNWLARGGHERKCKSIVKGERMLGIQPAEMICTLKAISFVVLLLTVIAVPWLHLINNELRARLNLC